MAEEESLNLWLERMYGLRSMSVHPSRKCANIYIYIYTAPILRASSIPTYSLSCIRLHAVPHVLCLFS